MSKQEKIVCAAIKFAIQKEDYKGEKVVAGVDYKSIVDGGVLRYLTHPDATNIWKLGFFTNANRFVDAREAVIIASHANQIHELTRLYAEYFEANDKGTHSYAKEKFSAYMDKLEEYKERGLKPEDLY